MAAGLLKREVSEVIRAKAHSLGAEEWLRSLDDRVEAIERSWAIRVGRSFSGGTEAFVAEADCVDGTPAVLKLPIPRPGAEARDEKTVLERAGGDGCARLLRADATGEALLLERLGPSLFDLRVPLRRRHEILCETASRVWRPAPDAGLRSGADKGRWLIDAVTGGWEELGRPCSERAVDHAVECAARRIAAHDEERAVLVHGDVHQWNALQSSDGFRLVDPDGLLAEREYDLGILMREDPVPLAHGGEWERAEWLAARTGCDAVATREWGVVERVSTGLVALRIGLEEEGRGMLAVADLVASTDP